MRSLFLVVLKVAHAMRFKALAGISFQRILTGKMNNAAVVGTVPGAQCPREPAKAKHVQVCASNSIFKGMKPGFHAPTIDWARS